MSNQLELTVLPILRAKKLSNQQVILEQKFLDGMLQYDHFWQGSIKVLMEEQENDSAIFGKTEVNVNDLPSAAIHCFEPIGDLRPQREKTADIFFRSL